MMGGMGLGEFDGGFNQLIDLLKRRGQPMSPSEPKGSSLGEPQSGPSTSPGMIDKMRFAVEPGQRQLGNDDRGPSIKPGEPTMGFEPWFGDPTKMPGYGAPGMPKAQEPISAEEPRAEIPPMKGIEAVAPTGGSKIVSNLMKKPTPSLTQEPMGGGVER